MENTTQKQHRLAIIGGGPVGIELAVRAVASGGFSHVTVLEAGDTPCAHVREWAHVRLFSSWSLDASEQGLAALDALAVPRPDPSAFPTGADLCAEYFDPLWRWLGGEHANGCAVSVKLQSRLVSVTRGALLKGDMVGRAGVPFRLLVSSPSSSEGDAEEEEREVEADVVADASGTFGQRNWIGQGGSPAVGERGLSKKGRVLAGIPNVAHDPAKFVGKTTMVVGSGYSAITFIAHLKRETEAAAASEAAAAALEAGSPSVAAATTRVIWVTRRGVVGADGGADEAGAEDDKTSSSSSSSSSSSLYARIPDDPLSERDALAQLANSFVGGARANDATGDKEGKEEETEGGVRGGGGDAAAAESPVSFVVEHKGGRMVQSLVVADVNDGGGSGGPQPNAPIRVTLAATASELEEKRGERGEERMAVVECDSVLAAVGYRPDTSLFQELQVHQCYATEGPMKLAAALMSAGGGGGDCLSQVVPGPATLVCPEPGFLVLGMKSYGRGSAFLLKVGHEQCDMALELLKQQQEQ